MTSTNISTGLQNVTGAEVGVGVLAFVLAFVIAWHYRHMSFRRPKKNPERD
jgi:hypothetical protein